MQKITDNAALLQLLKLEDAMVGGHKDEKTDETARIVHASLMNGLIAATLHARFPGSDIRRAMKTCFDADTYSVPDLTGNVSPDLCDSFHASFLNSSFAERPDGLRRIRSKSRFAQSGSVYTRKSIVRKIAEKTLSFWLEGHPGGHPRILDFACGTGRFYESAIQILNERFGIHPDVAVRSHVFAVDSDPVAVNVTRLRALWLAGNLSPAALAAVKSNVIAADALKFDNSPLGKLIPCAVVNDKYDVILSNPPYLVLKPTKKDTDKSFADKIIEMAAFFRKSGRYPLASEGMLNLYQLSIERMMQMLADGGEIGIICPATLFGDVSAARLRKYLLTSNKIREIEFFPENEQLFDNVSQATVIFHAKKGAQTIDILVRDKGYLFNVSLATVRKLFPKNFEVPFMSETEWRLLEKISGNMKLRDVPKIRNRRGELDLTQFRDFITSMPTPYRLVRGNMIKGDTITDINHEYVREDFPAKKSDAFIRHDFGRKRIICQQVCNAGLKKRLRFLWCARNDILGNSCNYISGEPEILSKLFIILNSSLLNWRFKITSSNNHINNYEIDELPVVDLALVDGTLKFESQRALDEYVGKLYGLTKNEIDFVSEGG